MSLSPINVTSPAGTQFAPTSLELDVLLAFMGSIMVDVLLYGNYLVLFCICMYILVRNGRSTHWFIPASAFVMFAVSTADIAISFSMIAHDFFIILQPSSFLFYVKAVYPKSSIFAVINNFIAELILLYRCYIIWGRSKYLLVGASLIVLGDSILGLYALLTSHSHIQNVIIHRWSLFAINIALTAVIVGRILWVSRIARPSVDCQSFRHHRIIAAILIETNVIYSGCLLASLLFPVSSPYAIIMGRISVRLVVSIGDFIVGLGFTRFNP